MWQPRASRREHVRLFAGGRLPGAARFAVRLASVAALAAGGVLLGRGVVGMANSRGNVEHVSAVSASAVQAHPTFTSTLRSWVAPPAVASEPAEQAPTPSSVAPSEPAPTSVPVAPEPGTYVVAEGDTLSAIAEQHAVDVELLARTNHLTDVNTLLAGARLVIPPHGAVITRSEQPAAQPTPRPVQASAPLVIGEGAATPDAAVRGFYAYLQQRQFEDAAGLWTAHMRSQYPPAENINSRFARTQSLMLTSLDVLQLDAANGRATVALRLTEVVGPPDTTRQYVGTWSLVRGPGGWLLDQPNLQPS